MKFEIDYETADKITLTNLVEHYNLVQEQITDYETGENDLHVDDYRYNLALIRALKSVVEYFGGEGYITNQESVNE